MASPVTTARVRAPRLAPHGPLGAAVDRLLDGCSRANSSSPTTVVSRPDATLPEEVLAALEALPRGAALLDDLDAQRTWYVLAELSGLGVEGVEDRADESPAVAAVRLRLGDLLEEAVRERVGPVEACTAAELPERIRAELEAVEGPALAAHLRRDGTVEHYRDLLRCRSIYHLREADPHTAAIPRLAGRAKAGLVEIQADEYGGGRVEYMHSTLYADAMAALDLDTAYGAYVDGLPAVALAWSNVLTLFASRRRLRACVAGHLVALECTSSIPNRRYGDGLRRLGYSGAATGFFDEHVEADAVHEQVAVHDLAVPLVEAEPELAADLVTGLRAALQLDADLTRYLFGRWGLAAD